MPFLTINGITIPIATTGASMSWARSHDGASPVASGQKRSAHRDHRRAWQLATHPLPASQARTLSEFVAGNQHIGLFHQGLELSTGLQPAPGYRDVQLLDLDLDGRGGGLMLNGSTGADAEGVICYPAQLYNQWTIIWQEKNGSAWTGAAIRDDGVGYVDGVLDATAGAAGTTLQIVVRDGVVYLDSDGNDVGVHQLVVAPYRIDSTWLVSMTAAEFAQQAPSPIHEVRGDALPEGWGDPVDSFRYALGRRVTYDFADRPGVDEAQTWDPAARVVKFELVEVDRFGKQSSALLAEPNLTPPAPLPEAASLLYDFDVLDPGTGNAPHNRGTHSPVGLLTKVGTASFSAAGGANGYPAWVFTRAGYYDPAFGGYTNIHSGEWTNAFLCRVDGIGRTIYSCGSSTAPGYSVKEETGAWLDVAVRGVNLSGWLPSAYVATGTEWGVYIETLTITGGPTYSYQMHYAPLGDSVIAESTTPYAVGQQQIGDRVQIGGSWAADEFTGRVMKCMTWDKLVDEQEILDYLNDRYA